MTNRILTCLCFAALVATSPVQAQDCTTLEQAQEAVVASGGRIAGAADYAGSISDTAILVETGDAIVLFVFKGGCLVGAAFLEPKAEVKPLT